jgi:hypothetical protein
MATLDYFVNGVLTDLTKQVTLKDAQGHEVTFPPGALIISPTLWAAYNITQQAHTPTATEKAAANFQLGDANWRASIRRQAVDLKAKGKQLDALLLLKTIGE